MLESTSGVPDELRQHSSHSSQHSSYNPARPACIQVSRNFAGPVHFAGNNLLLSHAIAIGSFRRPRPSISTAAKPTAVESAILNFCVGPLNFMLDRDCLRATWFRCVPEPIRTMWLRAICTLEDSTKWIIIIEYNFLKHLWFYSVFLFDNTRFTGNALYFIFHNLNNFAHVFWVLN